MKVNGQIELDTPEGKMTIQGKDLQVDDYTTGSEIELSHDTGDWSVKKVFGGEPGVGDGDWETEKCSIISEDIDIDYIVN